MSRKKLDLVIICGPPASGKMTIGQELQKITGFKLFHNHMSLELVNQFFDFGTPHFRSLDKTIRFSIFEEISKSELAGLIFTFVWAFNEKEDEIYIDEIIEIFSHRDLKVSIAELNCSLEERLKRNKGENRLKHKPSKRNIEFSDGLLLDAEKRYRMNSMEGELSGKSIFKLNNTDLSAEESAEKIAEHFKLIR